MYPPIFLMYAIFPHKQFINNSTIYYKNVIGWKLFQQLFLFLFCEINTTKEFQYFPNCYVVLSAGICMSLP